MNLRQSKTFFALLIFLSLPRIGNGAETPFYPGFPALHESRAYQTLIRRPITDRTKIMYLMDRFSEANIQIIYDGYYFNAVVASGIARWFFARNYRGETSKQWIMRWCNKSINGEFIRVKLPDGTFKLAREILLDEIKSLEDMLAKERPSLTALPSPV